MNTDPVASRHHPFGRGANAMVLAGTSLSIVQSAVVAIAVVLAPVTEGFDLEGAGLVLWLAAGVGFPAIVGWMALRALRSWWRRSVTVVPRLVVAGVLAVPSTLLLVVPLGDEQMTPIGYLPAGLLIMAGAILARRRVVAAQDEGRGGLAS